jgi:ATP-dependent protease ClpP protease subunit
MYEPAIIKETSEGMSRYSVHDAMFQRREVQCICSVDADMVNSLIAQIRYLAAEAPNEEITIRNRVSEIVYKELIYE